MALNLSQHLSRPFQWRIPQHPCLRDWQQDPARTAGRPVYCGVLAKPSRCLLRMARFDRHGHCLSATSGSLSRSVRAQHARRTKTISQRHYAFFQNVLQCRAAFCNLRRKAAAPKPTAINANDDGSETAVTLTLRVLLFPVPIVRGNALPFEDSSDCIAEAVQPA